MAEKIVNLIYGRNPIKEALKANRVLHLYLLKNFEDKEVSPLLREYRGPITYVTRSELDEFTSFGVHQGMAANIKEYSYSSLQEIITKGKKVERPIILLLDGIEDPHNLGAILRSADVFGVSGIIIPKHHSVMLNATVAKTSAGAINYVPVAIVNNLNNTIKELKEEGYWVVSADGSGTSNYQDIDYNMPVALVIGSEGNGISQLVLKNSDFIVKIPMYGQVNSLNASVATGILLAHIRH